MHRRILLVFLLAALFVLLVQPAAALLVRLPGGWEADVTLCRDGYSVRITGVADSTGDEIVVTLLDAVNTATLASLISPPITLLEITTTEDNQAVDQSYIGSWNSAQTPGTIVDMTMVRTTNGTGGDDERQADAAEPILDCYISPAAGATDGGVFLGNPRNLVLIANTSTIYDAPNGNAVGVMQECKTAFVLDIQDGFYRLAVMGGWVDGINILDVAENYGQPGAGIYPPCA